MSRTNRWPTMKLGDICDIIYGKALKKRDRVAGPVPVYGSNGVVDYHSEALFEGPTIVVGRKGSAGAVEWSDSSCWIIDTAFSVRPRSDDVDLRWLYWALKYLDLGKLQKHAAVPGISKSDVLREDILLPPITEQQRIADVLNQTTSILEFARQEVRKIDESRSALFESLFPASNYPASTIGNFLSETQYGSSKKSGEAGKYPMLRMGNLSATGSISYSDLKYLNLEEKEINKYTLRNRDILFNRTNSKELVGKTAVYYGEDDQIAYAGYLIRCRTNHLATPEFISGFLNSRIGKAQLLQRAKAIVGMANINAKELRTLRIPAVPVEEQEKYTFASQQLENLRLAVKKKVKRLEELQQSLSTRAFAGQL